MATMSPSATCGNGDVLAEEVVALVDVAGDGDALRWRRVGPVTDDELELACRR